MDDMGVEGLDSKVTISFDPAAGTYILSDPDASATFATADRTSTDGGIDTYATQTGSTSDELQLLNNVRSDASQADGPVQLTYLSYGIWSHSDSQTGDSRKTYLLFGYPTATADMPRTGSATYATNVVGSMLDVVSRTESDVGGSATFSADFAAGTVSTDLTLVATATQFQLGSFSGTGTIGAASFQGTFTSDTPFFSTGDFVGGFFGPSAKEMGYTFAIRKFNPDPYAGASANFLDQWITGAVVGTKN